MVYERLGILHSGLIQHFRMPVRKIRLEPIYMVALLLVLPALQIRQIVDMINIVKITSVAAEPEFSGVKGLLKFHVRLVQ